MVDETAGDEFYKIPDRNDPDLKWRGAIVLKDMDEFYNSIDKGESNMGSRTPEVKHFVSRYRLINEGCNCAKKKRIRIAEDAYRLVAEISDREAQQSFQQHYKASSVIFKQDGRYLGTLGVPSDEFDEPVY